jgi:hypothetical protein
MALTYFKVENGGGFVNVNSDDEGTDVVIVFHVDGKIEITPDSDLRFEMSVGKRPLRVHLLAERARILG